MNFSKLRHRVIFLKPTDTTTNSMNEAIPKYEPFKPYAKNQDEIIDFSVAGLVVPMSGREYEESQKIRAETTYKISTRYFPGITAEMRIFHNGREFEIISILDLDGRREELQIIAIEKDRKTAQNYEGDSDGN